MKKMETIACMAMAGMIGIGCYALMNKSTKNKADKLINNMLDKANSMTSNMMSNKEN